MQPRHADVLNPQRLERRQASSAFLPPQLHPFRNRSLAVAGEPEDEVPVRAPREELHATRVGGVAREWVGRRVGAVDGRVVDVKGREALEVFQAGVDVVAGEKHSSCSNVLQMQTVSIGAV